MANYCLKPPTTLEFIRTSSFAKIWDDQLKESHPILEGSLHIWAHAHPSDQSCPKPGCISFRKPLKTGPLSAWMRNYSRIFIRMKVCKNTWNSLEERAELWHLLNNEQITTLKYVWPLFNVGMKTLCPKYQFASHEDEDTHAERIIERWERDSAHHWEVEWIDGWLVGG